MHGKQNMQFTIFIVLTLLAPVAVMIHCLINIAQGNALHTYDLVIMDHPVLTNLDVTYLEVFIADLLTIIAFIVALALRYFYYRHERDFIKKYNIQAKTGFTRDFKPSQSTTDYQDYE